MFLPLRDENPTTHFPWVTTGLLVANGLAFAWLFLSGESARDLVGQFGFVPALFHPAPSGLGNTPWFSLFTSLFLHAGLMHLGGNLLFLWIFGNNIEDTLGPVRFVLFYVIAGLGGHWLHGVMEAGSTIPTIGASGAISGILAAYLLRFPKARVVTLLFLIVYMRTFRIPAVVLIGFWLLQQVWYGASLAAAGPVEAGGGVAWFEHLGGFATGLVAFLALGGRPEGWRR